MTRHSRADRHLKAIAQEIKSQGPTDGSPAQWALAGVLHGILTAQRVYRGASAEQAMEQLAADVQQAADAAGTEPAAAEEQAAPVDWQAIVHQREGELKREGEKRARAEQERDAVYRERHWLLGWLAAEHTAVIVPALDISEPGWQLLYLYAGDTQMSWHIGPADATLFAHVTRVATDDPRARWDGHTTAEKYAAIQRLTTTAASATPTKVQGRCPACTRPTLSLAPGGTLRCTSPHCHQPHAAATLLGSLTAYRLARIASAHSKSAEEGGTTSGDCTECGHPHPCPTWVWATSDRDPLSTWDPADDAPAPDECPASMLAAREGPVSRCIVEGPHEQHVDAVGRRWRG
ncbi:hypothetical protein [Streptomyces sp. C10-9-1]|uniref:hypothetical protein n=1 Tax=Streptomyces sp. C10-9-1 TaxID=1859285 RepID=UPI003F4A0693